MRILISCVIFLLTTVAIAKLLFTSPFVGNVIDHINYGDAFSDWRVRLGWVGLESEEDLWTYICLTIGALISLPLGIYLYRSLS